MISAAGPVVAGALAMGSMAVIGQGMSDVLSGQVSSMETYMSTGFWSAVAGAVSGGVGSCFSGLFSTKLTLAAQMGVNGFSGVVETVVENAILGVKTELSDLGLAFGMSSFLPGIGDNLARGLKGMAGQLDNVLRGASRQADEALEAALKQTDDLAEAAAKQADDMLEAAGKQADKLAEAAAKQADGLAPRAPDADTPDVQVEGGRYSELGDMSLEDGKRYSAWSTLREEGLSYEQAEQIKAIDKGKKPAPETYLSDDYIKNHLQSFKDSGAVKIMPNAPSGTIGGKGGTFIMSGDELSEIIQYADGDVAKIERILGLDPGYLGDNPVIVMIEDTSTIRVPSGNELGAWLEYWEPGGYTNGGIKEAVIDPIPEGSYTYKHLFE